MLIQCWHSSINDGVPGAAAGCSIRSGYGFPFALVAPSVGSEFDFSHTFNGLSAGNSIFTHHSIFNSIRLDFQCALSALLLDSRCCFLHDNAVATE